MENIEVRELDEEVFHKLLDRYKRCFVTTHPLDFLEGKVTA